MKTMMSHTIYLLFYLKLQSFFSFLLICSVFSSKDAQEKILVEIILNSQKRNQEWVDLFGFKKPTRGFLC